MKARSEQMVSLTERSSVLYADVGGVCLDGLAQRLCLWGYTRIGLKLIGKY